MVLALTTLCARLLRASEPRTSPTPETGRTTPCAPSPAPPKPKTHCFEVLLPYTDAHASEVRGMAPDFRHSLVVWVWATDVATACRYARERFREHRIRHREARLVAGGPVPLRIVREAERAA